MSDSQSSPIFYFGVNKLQHFAADRCYRNNSETTAGDASMIPSVSSMKNVTHFPCFISRVTWVFLRHKSKDLIWSNKRDLKRWILWWWRQFCLIIGHYGLFLIIHQAMFKLNSVSFNISFIGWLFHFIVLKASNQQSIYWFASLIIHSFQIFTAMKLRIQSSCSL